MPPDDSAHLLLTGASLADGGVADVLVRAGRVEATGPAAESALGSAPAHRLDLTGFVLLPAPAEPHAHLDKALLADRVPNPAGDLRGAIVATRAAYATMGRSDVESRARRALRIALARGFTAVRTHANCEEGIGTAAVSALCDVRAAARGALDLQVIAMAGFPITGVAGAENRRLLTAALAAGADGVGGAPALDDDPARAVTELVRAAADGGVPIDLHLDETLDARSLTISRFIDEVEAHGLAGRATASHCVSLGQLDPEHARALAVRLAQARIAVVTLPQTNLYLQGRETETRVPRGLTAISVLRRAGVVLAGGGDNWRDPFNPLARIDPLETASLLVAAGHLPPAEAYAAVSDAARRALGLEAAGPVPGAVADLLALRGANLAEALAHAGDERLVFHAGRLVARTSTAVEVAADL